MKNLKLIYQQKFEKAKIKSYPFLHPKRINPYEVFGDFFDAGDIESHLAELKELYDKATSKKFLKKQPHSIMYDYKLFSEILNATWIVCKTKVKSRDIPFRMQELVMPGGVLTDCTLQRYLMEDEIKNPYLGFFHCYNDFALATYHRNLHIWFFFGMSKKDFLGKDKETKKTYKNLCRIIICTWPIYENELLGNKIEN